MIGNIVLIAAIAILVYAGYRFVGRYQAAEGSRWQKLITAAKGSATVLWQYIVGAGGYLMIWTVNAADAFNLPDVRAWIQAHLSAEMFGITLLAVALIGFLARLRTL